MLKFKKGQKVKVVRSNSKPMIKVWYRNKTPFYTYIRSASTQHGGMYLIEDDDNPKRNGHGVYAGDMELC